jgi:hypothetical protein
MRRLSLGVWDVEEYRYDSGIGHPSSPSSARGRLPRCAPVHDDRRGNRRLRGYAPGHRDLISSSPSSANSFSERTGLRLRACRADEAIPLISRQVAVSECERSLPPTLQACGPQDNQVTCGGDRVASPGEEPAIGAERDFRCSYQRQAAREAFADARFKVTPAMTRRRGRRSMRGRPREPRTV